MDLALNNLHWLICHETKPNQTKPNTNVYVDKYTVIGKFRWTND